jgi:surface protein
MTWMFIGDPNLTTIYATDKWSTAKVTDSSYMFYGDTKIVGSMGTTYDAAHIDHEYAQIDGGLCDPGYLSGEYESNIPVEPYAVLKDSVLTFYYDNSKNCREGKVYEVEEEYWWPHVPGWYENRLTISQVVFDSSFKKYLPTSTSHWFYCCQNIVSFENLTYLNTSEVTDMSRMFGACESLVSIDLSNFNTEKVKRMDEMFWACDFTFIDLSKFKTHNVVNMSSMFNGCKNLKTLDLSNFDTEKVITMQGMFASCKNLTSLNISSFNTSNVKYIRDIFNGCESLKTVDLRGFNTVNVEDMQGMFANCKSLYTLNLSSFNTINVTNMNGMFKYCNSLKTLDLTSFNTANVKVMEELFFECRNLESVDLSSFNTSEVSIMSDMFNPCVSLKTVYVSNLWSTENVKYSSKMFYYCTNLVGGAGTVYDTNHRDHTYARIDGGPSAPGYLTYKAAPIARGDVNGDGVVDSDDIVTITNVMAGVTTDPAIVARADVNGDGSVNIGDIVAVASIIAVNP